METPTPTNLPGLDRVAVMRALGDPLRWDIVAALAQGTALAVSDLTARLGRERSLVSKDLALLLAAGAVEVHRDAGQDARRQLYSVPARYLTSPGVVDYGFCLLRFNAS